MACGTCQKCEDGCTSIRDFAVRVVPHAAGAPMNVIEDNVQMVLQDFAKRTGIIERVICIETQAGVCRYELDVPCDELIHRINKVTDNDCYCPDPLRDRPHFDQCIGDKYYFEPKCTLYLAPTPQCDGQKIYVEVTTIPSRAVCEVDDRFFEYHSQAIVDGTIARLASMSQSEWSNAGVAARKDREYEDQLYAASCLEKRQFSGGPMRARGRGWL